MTPRYSFRDPPLSPAKMGEWIRRTLIFVGFYADAYVRPQIEADISPDYELLRDIEMRSFQGTMTDADSRVLDLLDHKYERSVFRENIYRHRISPSLYMERNLLFEDIRSTLRSIIEREETKYTDLHSDQEE